MCRDLDGLPLAIELAAARVRMLSADQIAAAMSDRFRLLTRRAAHGRRAPADAPRLGRLESRPALADERLLLRRVAVFAGGFTLEAAEEVCAGDGIERDQMLDLLGSLVDQSLVSADEHDAGMRYRLLETVRQYGLERLTAAGEEAAVRARHREHLRRAGRAGRLRSSTPPARAHGSLSSIRRPRTSPRRSTTRCGAIRGRRCACAPRCTDGGCARGRFGEAELACSRALDACRDREPGLRCTRRSTIARGSPSRRATRRRRPNAREPRSRSPRTWATRALRPGRLATIGEAAHFTDPAAGRVELARATELAQAAGDDWALVTAGLSTAFTFMYEHDHARATAAIAEVAAKAERLGDPYHLARRWFYVGWMALMDGAFADARDALERMLAAVDGVGDPTTEANADICVGFMEIWEGDAERALARLQATLERSLKLGSAVLFPMLMVAISAADLAAGRSAEARDRLVGMLPLIEGRDGYGTTWSLCVLAEAHRLQGDDAAEATAAARTSERRADRQSAARDAGPAHLGPASRVARRLAGRPAARVRPPRGLSRRGSCHARPGLSGRTRGGGGGDRRPR